MIISDRTTNIYTLEKDYAISVSETECSHRVKPVVLFNYMQDLAEKSISIIGEQYSCEGLAKKGYGWFIIRYRIEFENYLSDLKNINIKTESRGCQKSTFYRDFEIYDNNSNQIILRAVSSWFIVDLGQKSIVNIEKEYPEFLQFTPREDDLQLEKLKHLTQVTKEKFFEIRYDDLDINNHVNNTVYISWALEALDYEFRKNHIIKSIDVYFKRDVEYGDKICSQVYIDEENSATEHLIKNANTGDSLCLLKIEYNKI